MVLRKMAMKKVERERSLAEVRENGLGKVGQGHAGIREILRVCRGGSERINLPNFR